VTNQAIITSNKNLSSSEEEYDPKKQPWFELVQHWIPRLLGIVPLVVLTSSLMSQGGIQFGAEMYLISLASIFVLLSWYILVFSLSAKCTQDSYVPIKPGFLNSFSDNLINFFLLKERKPKKLNQIQLLGHSILYKFTSVPWTLKKSYDLQPTTASINYSNDFRQDLIQRFALASKSLKEVFLYLWFLRIQVFIALISALLFQTGQVNDIVLAIILDRDWPAFLFAILFAFLLSLLLWHTSRYLTWVVPELKKGNDISTDLFTPTAEMILLWLAWFSLALFTVPIAEQAYGPLKLFGLNQNDNNYLWHIYFLLLFQAGIIYLWRKFDFPKSTWTPRFRRRFIRLYGIGLILPFLFKNLKAYEIPELVGSLGVLFWALSTILIVTSVVYQFSTLTGIPLLSTIIIGAYFMNINRINDNHTIRLKKPEYSIRELHKKEYKKLPRLEDKFDNWMSTQFPVSTDNGIKKQTTILDLARSFNKKCKEQNSEEKDKMWHEDCRYPIYIASAQGGGIYAAYHTAKTFQTITDKVPNFRNHLFAISSVSGGSVGSAIYVNWLRNCGTKNEKIDIFFDRPRDPLALIVASMFFGDLFQRFYPIPVAAWDRSLGLELAFEPRNKVITDKIYSSNSESSKAECINLSESFFKTQDVKEPFPNPDKDTSMGNSYPTPFLVLNTTEVDNGRRYLISPFRISALYTDADFHEPWPAGVEKPQFRDIAYSTAAGLSARFPLISPYGFFPEQRARLFIDGGLYDNSGAITATEIVTFLSRDTDSPDRTRVDEMNRRFIKVKNPYYNLIRFEQISILDKTTIDLNSNYSTPEQLAKTNKFKFFGWTALTSVFSTRESRTGKAVDTFINIDNGFKTNNVISKVLIEKQFLLGGMPSPLFSIPLGWKLSCQARAFINDQLQVNKSRHVFIPCELKNGKMLKREPVRSRPLIYQSLEQERTFEYQQDPSYSINMLISRIRSQIDRFSLEYYSPGPRIIY
jgi:hypothetical protein